MINLRRGLKKRDQHGRLPEVRKVAQCAHDLESGCAVQACADLVQEEGFLGADQQLSRGDALSLAAADSSDLIVADQCL